jgi:hypothetical protein
MTRPARSLRMAMTVLWPAFLVAAFADGLVFSLFDPARILPEHAPLSPLAVYTIGFFFFWVMGALASMLSCYLALVPDDHQGPF